MEDVGLETDVAVECGQRVLVMESFLVQDFGIVDYVSSRHSELPRTNTGQLEDRDTENGLLSEGLASTGVHYRCQVFGL